MKFIPVSCKHHLTLDLNLVCAKTLIRDIYHKGPAVISIVVVVAAVSISYANLATQEQYAGKKEALLTCTEGPQYYHNQTYSLATETCD